MACYPVCIKKTRKKQNKVNGYYEMKIRKIIDELTVPFKALNNRVFSKLCFAQAVSLLGMPLPGLALISYQVW